MENTLENGLEKLNQIITDMDKNGISLDEAFVKYDEGMKLVKECKEKLDMYDKKLIIVNEESANEK